MWVYLAVLLWCNHSNDLHLQTGATPLLIACQKGHLPVVEYLIAAKADVNTPSKVGNLIHSADHC